MLKKDSELLYLFAKEPWKKYTFTELKNSSKKKSKSYVDKVIKNLLKEKILLLEKVGNLSVYSLNFIVKSRIFAGFVLEYYGWHKDSLPYRDLQEFMSNISYKDYVFIITGSYANGKFTKTSDLDVVVLINDLFEPKRVYAELSFKAEMNIPQIHLYVFKYSEFKEMLLNNEANYGKGIVRNFIILTGGQIYIKLMQEVIENGFNNKKFS